MRALQALLQQVFMHLDAAFNRAFGDRVNPLYHLGAMSFFLFWIVAGSGLYLYGFFETGVSEAYASVQALTHGQWFAGGVLRSVHRYASDAMVLTMTVHLVRHFAFGHFRGFRWFSWATGVALIWLLYASGINGYMLPWDRLAQFVIVASFEWLDWLPSFGGTLIRNFIHPGSVGDRFFSLLSFLHIGLPLFLLLLMWVHVQRVPKARTAPPRPIMASLGALLLALAVVQPVASQGGAADLATAVPPLRLDWFYLPLFPLLNDWPLGRAWTLVAGGTALLLLVPLWPAGRRAARGERLVVVHGRSGPPHEVHARTGETLLEAGLREGLALPYECRNGGCGKCLCTVTHGSVEHRPYQRSALPDAQRALGAALMCCAVPVGDVVVEVPGLEDGSTVAAGRVHTGRVVALDRLAPEVMRVVIELPAGESLRFEAGQYINVLAEDGGRRAFSFANPPHEHERIELHVRRIPGGRFTGHVFEAMQVGDELRFEGPLGGFTLRDGDRPILFVAGATGFAPVKSILEDAFARGVHRPMRLYWGVRRPDDLYLLELARRWQREHPNFQVVPVVSQAAPEDAWLGRTGLVHEAMLADYGDLSGFEVYVCGSVQMVETAVPAFLQHGLGEGACFSDAFLPATRVAQVA
jgi:CDP-4-dehydro-6-deoxyglucose reductase, E3